MYRKHRERFLEKLAETGSAAVIPTASHKVRNHDCEYRFRPTSDFWYLTGFDEPESVLVLLPDGVRGASPKEDGEKDAKPVRSILFLRERDPAKETWTGRRLGVERAPEALGVDEARPISELWSALGELLVDYPRIYYRIGTEAEDDRRMLEVLAGLRNKARGTTRSPYELVDPAPILHEMRLFKSEEELVLMREAASISREAHEAAMASAEPGMNECEVEALIEYVFRSRGGTGCAYATIVAGGENACVLHYVTNDMTLEDGGLLLIDAGAEYDYYAADITRTFPINGTFTLEQRAIYDLVLEAEETAIAAVAPGVPFDTIHETALRVLVRGMLRLGLLEGTEEKVIEDESYRRFFMHKTSHFLGLDVHDCGAQALNGKFRPLEPGMVFTVEPGLYVSADDETVEERWRGIGVRIEDDVLVTETGYEVLTEGTPKTVEEVEAACRGETLEPAV